MAEGPYEEDERPVIPVFVPAVGLPPARGRHLLPDALAPVHRGLRRAGGRSRDELLPARPGRLGRVERGGAGRRGSTCACSRARAPPTCCGGFTGRIGRQPPVPAPFVFGPWYQPTRRRRGGLLEQLRDRDVPLSVAQTYTHYLPCAAQAGREDAERARVARFHDAGLAVTTYFNPMICTGHPSYADAAAGGALVKNPAGGPYEYRYTTLDELPAWRSSTSPRRAGRGTSTGACCARRWRTATTAGWRTSASTPRSTPCAADGIERRRRCTTPIPRQYHCGAAARRGRRQPPAGPLRALGLDGQRALLAGGLGRRPHRGLGLRRPALGGHQRADHGALGREHAGAPTSAASSRCSRTSSRRSCWCAGSRWARCPG